MFLLIFTLLLLTSIVKSQTCTADTTLCATNGGDAQLWENCGQIDVLGDNVVIGDANATCTICGTPTNVIAQFERTTANAFTAGVDGYVTWVSNTFKTGDNAPTVVSGTRVQANIHGIYHFEWDWNSGNVIAANTYVFVWVRKSGLTPRYGEETEHGNTANPSNRQITLNGGEYLELQVGQYIELGFHSNSAGLLPCSGNGCRLTLRLIERLT